ncbi:MAG: dual specificity protein phosphatase family protein [Anaerolineales bacterium]|nr:dual specificity protein phosphatase family protein [Anaerolineales bacterium]
MTEKFIELPFELPGRVFRSPMPFGNFAEADLLTQYHAAGVDVVVQLVADDEALQRMGRNLRVEYQAQGFDVIYMPIMDFFVPDLNALRKAVGEALSQARIGRNLVVHCNAGIGRTGLFLSCMARKRFDWGGEDAIGWVRQFVEHAVEVPEQVKMVEDFC